MEVCYLQLHIFILRNAALKESLTSGGKLARILSIHRIKSPNNFKKYPCSFTDHNIRSWHAHLETDKKQMDPLPEGAGKTF